MLTKDAIRTTAVEVSAVVAVVGSVIGSGFVVGTPIEQAAGGALAADATLVAPAGTAFSIWSVIYTGLIILAVYQALGSQREDARQRRAGWWVVASLLLNAAWILIVQAGSVLGSLVVIVALLLVLLVTLGQLNRTRPTSPVQAFLLDGVMGFYTGWVVVATVANAAAALVDVVGWDAVGAAATTWAVGLLLLAGLVGVAVVSVGPGRFGPALSLAWGLVWVAVARTSGSPTSVVVSVVAVLLALVVLAAPVLARLRSRSSAAPRSR